MFRPMCPSAFFRFFMSNSGSHTESQTVPFIWSKGVDCSNTVNNDRVQILNYSKYSLLVLLVVGIVPATSRWFHSETLSNKTSSSTWKTRRRPKHISAETLWVLGVSIFTESMWLWIILLIIMSFRFENSIQYQLSILNHNALDEIEKNILLHNLFGDKII